MKHIDWTKWSAIAEILSAVAIVVTLLYLAIQTQHVADQTRLLADQTQQLTIQNEQNQQLAMVEGSLSFASSRNDVLALINTHPEIWLKGNANETLSDVEYIIYENQVDAYTDNYFFNYFQQLLTGNEVFAETNVAQVAYVLFRNPGAYIVWEELERRTNTSIDAVVGADRRTAEGRVYDEAVRAAVEQFRQAEN